MTMPSSIEFTRYTNDKDVLGFNGSEYEGVCAIADLYAVYSTMIRSYDGEDLGSYPGGSALNLLKCKTFHWGWFKNDPLTGKAEFTAKYIPAWKIEIELPGFPFRRRIEFGSQSFTLTGKQAKWQDTGDIIANANIQPLLTVAVDHITLFGTKTPVDLSTYAGFENRVNSDAYLGIPVGCGLFLGAGANNKMLDDGTIVDDVEIRIDARAIPWNKDYRESDGTWQTVLINGNPKFGSIAFSGIPT